MNNIIEFKIIDPSNPPDAEWESEENPSPYVSLDDGLEESISKMVDRDEIVINKPFIRIMFSYPLSNDFIIDLTSSKSHFTREDIARAVAMKYQQIYTEEEESSSITPETYAEKNLKETGHYGGLLNRVNTNGSWGIWGSLP